jgi:hypothetical protein
MWPRDLDLPILLPFSWWLPFKLTASNSDVSPFKGLVSIRVPLIPPVLSWYLTWYHSYYLIRSGTRTDLILSDWPDSATTTTWKCHTPSPITTLQQETDEAETENRLIRLLLTNCPATISQCAATPQEFKRKFWENWMRQIISFTDESPSERDLQLHAYWALH